jgi:hypothetical protein
MMMSSSSLLRSAVNHRGITSSRYYSTSLLHSESIGIKNRYSNDDGNSSSSILFLHGLLGNGRNLKPFAKQVCEIQQTQGQLMDLRGGMESLESCKTKPIIRLMLVSKTLFIRPKPVLKHIQAPSLDIPGAVKSRCNCSYCSCCCCYDTTTNGPETL